MLRCSRMKVRAARILWPAFPYGPNHPQIDIIDGHCASLAPALDGPGAVSLTKLAGTCLDDGDWPVACIRAFDFARRLDARRTGERAIRRWTCGVRSALGTRVGTVSRFLWGRPPIVLSE